MKHPASTLRRKVASMTETQQAAAAAQAANGQAPAPGPAPGEDTTGEKWLGVLVIAAGCFLLLAGIDRLTGGRLTAALQGGDDGG